MDPNAALARLRMLANMIAADVDGGYPVDAERAQEIATTFEGLDSWLSSGGFLPTDWRSGTALSE